MGVGWGEAHGSWGVDHHICDGRQRVSSADVCQLQKAS